MASLSNQYHICLSQSQMAWFNSILTGHLSRQADRRLMVANYYNCEENRNCAWKLIEDAFSNLFREYIRLTAITPHSKLVSAAKPLKTFNVSRGSLSCSSALWVLDEVAVAEIYLPLAEKEWDQDERMAVSFIVMPSKQDSWSYRVVFVDIETAQQ